MKILIPILSLLLLSTAGAKGQTTAGTFSISGAGSFDTNRKKYTDDNEVFSGNAKHNNSYLFLHTSVGYFVADNLEIGVFGNTLQYYSVGRSYSKSINLNIDSESFYKSRYYDYSAGLFAKKYFFLTDRLALTASSSIRYGFSSSKRTQESKNANMEDEPKTTTRGPRSNELSVGLGAGITYFVTDKFGINAGLGGLNFSKASSKGNGTTADGVPYAWRTKSNSAGFGFSSQYINLGLSYYFGGS